MSVLSERLAEADRQTVVQDTVQLIDDEVSRKGGLSGAALKAGYRVVKKIKSGRFLREVVDHLLDPFTGALGDLYDTFLEQAEVTTFERYLGQHDQVAAAALLRITDDRAARSDNKLLRSTYDKLRGQAERHVCEALPGVGRIIDRHAPRTAA